MNTQEQNFETLLKEANKVSDARTKKAIELKDKFFDEILPKFAEAIKKLGIEYAEFETREAVTTLDYYMSDPFDGYWIKISNTGKLFEAEKLDFNPEGVKIIYYEIEAKREELSFLGTLELCKQIPERLKRIIQKAETETEQATSITDEL